MSTVLKGFAYAAGVSCALSFGVSAFATSTIECRSAPLDADGQVAFARYNVGFGMPGWWLAGYTLSDETVGSDSPNELDPTAYFLTGFFSDEEETKMQAHDELGNRVLLLKTKKTELLEAGFLTVGGRTHAVTCEQIG